MNTPAPWTLAGRGFILTYHFPAAFIRESGFLQDNWKEFKWSGFGFVMLFDYEVSPVGPYHELIFIPGKTIFGESKLGTISKNYVDSVASMQNGRKNWGIPKELAEFNWTHEDRRQRIQVGNGISSFEILLEPGSIPFPVNTRFMPIHLIQELDGKKFQVSPSGKGTGHFTLIKDVLVDPQFFPGLQHVEPSVAIYVDPFHLTFPAARIEPVDGYK